MKIVEKEEFKEVHYFYLKVGDLCSTHASRLACRERGSFAYPPFPPRCLHRGEMEPRISALLGRALFSSYQKAYNIL